MSQVHDSPTGGHMGVAKTLEKLQQRFYWVKQRSTVEEWCKKCNVCNSRKSLPKKRCAPLQPIQIDDPLKCVAMDILGPLPTTARGNKYVLAVGDYFTKWTEAYPMTDSEATTVARLLVNEFICRFGVPEQLLTDQGRNFESTLIKQICQLLGIRKTRTTPYHPQSDGMVERFNRTLLSMLSVAVEESEGDWDLKIPTIMFAYRSSVHESTGESPFCLMFGCEAPLPVDVMYKLARNNESPKSPAKTRQTYCANVSVKLMQGFALIWRNSETSRSHTTTLKCTAKHTKKEILYGYIVLLSQRVAPVNCIDHGKGHTS